MLHLGLLPHRTGRRQRLGRLRSTFLRSAPERLQRHTGARAQRPPSTSRAEGRQAAGAGDFARRSGRASRSRRRRWRRPRAGVEPSSPGRVRPAPVRGARRAGEGVAAADRSVVHQEMVARLPVEARACDVRAAREVGSVGSGAQIHLSRSPPTPPGRGPATCSCLEGSRLAAGRSPQAPGHFRGAGATARPTRASVRHRWRPRACSPTATARQRCACPSSSSASDAQVPIRAADATASPYLALGALGAVRRDPRRP